MRIITERDHYYFKKKVHDLVEDEYSVLGYYRGIHTKLLFQHNCEKCGNHQFMMRPHDFLKGQRCPYCQKHFRKSTKDFSREIRLKFNGRVSLVSDYNGPRKQVRIRCNVCGRERNIYPYNLDKEPECFCQQQLAEKRKLSEAFKNKNLKFKENFKMADPLTNSGPEFDFLFSIGDSKILIDYQDLSHFQPIYFNKENLNYITNWDKIKKEFIELNGIFYIKIGFWNLDRFDEIAEILRKYLESNKKMTSKRFEIMRAELHLGSYKNYRKKLKEKKENENRSE